MDPMGIFGILAIISVIILRGKVTVLQGKVERLSRTCKELQEQVDALEKGKSAEN